MKVVQTEVSSEEHVLLVQRAKEAQKSLKELLRSIIRSYLSSEGVDADDPFFALRFEGQEGERGSIEHDTVLYGPDDSR
ncbi:hypothetical protein EU538_13185 [Candidatus Thorarchaeota archaeon]|nr:MAG: hypothetical protein EU538_13185 [Candidatus Thorarchaeota archaeon]